MTAQNNTLKILEQIIAEGVQLTPMMKQYYDIKKQYPDLLLLFRMGDFYEVFFDDAREASRLLNITLTHRGKLGDTPIPMAGIPHHAAVNYIDRITALGLRVAICEQIEDPKEAKGIVKRAVTQIVGPAMPFDLDKSQGRENLYIAAGFVENNIYYLCALDFTTGDFWGMSTPEKSLFLEKLHAISPKEFLCYMGQWENDADLDKLLTHLEVLKTYLGAEYFTEKFTGLYLEKIFPGYQRDKTLKSHAPLLNAAGAIAYYLTTTQQHKAERFSHIRPFRFESVDGTMKVSPATLIGLEILPRARETYKESLLGFFDRTQTAMGTRSLRNLFLKPLTKLSEILNRQKLISFLIDQNDLHEKMREILTGVRDIERIMAKLSTGKAVAGDLINIAVALESYEKLQGLLNDPAFKFNFITKNDFSPLNDLSKKIRATINDEIGASLDKGNLIKNGVNKQRDRLYKLSMNANDELLVLEEKYRTQTKIPKLRLKSNNVNGYFIEIPRSQSEKVPRHFSRMQTLVNAERYMTDELEAFEKEIVAAAYKLEKLEREIFKDIVENVLVLNDLLAKVSIDLATLDNLQSLAFVSRQEKFTLPQISEHKKILKVEGAWHPLIRAALQDHFVPHDLLLDEKIFFGLITGPNMAGKTTVMREMAIIQFLTQIGCPVPATNCHVGICDFLFSRLGASDDILKGQSTFMVEMSETAEIVRHATNKSLIILDEVGRGTSTYDGLSIAWSLVEHFLNQTRALCLFATHYHELIEVVEHHSNGKNLTVETKNEKGNVQFLYRLIEAAATQSFGIYVAKLAGLPQSILNRSEAILKKLEAAEQNETVVLPKSGTQLCFFDELDLSHCDKTTKIEYRVPEHLKKIEEELKDLDVLNLTPWQAIQKIQAFKETIIEVPPVND